MAKSNWSRAKEEAMMSRFRQESRLEHISRSIRGVREPGPMDLLISAAQQKLRSTQRPRCPDCGIPMRLKPAKDQARVFWACPQFPACKGKRWIDQTKFKAFVGDIA